ncbi:MAG: long-chain fatty acid--CoA ligase [Rhodospirillales bacterium]|nr:long-chain fatty acid--CoA ligase [Rhodospirillales bacterium]
MDLATCPNLVNLFFDRAEARGEHPFLWSKADGKFRPQTWREVAAQISELAHGLQALGVKKDDRVVLVSENRPEWLIADLAIMAAGGVTVPAYTTNTVDDHRHIINNSGAVGLILSTSRLAKTALPAAHTAEALRFAITMEPVDLQQSLNVEVLDWHSALNRGQNVHRNVLQGAGALRRTDTACIIYTSGTGGVPKGVVTTHGAILHNLAGATAVLDKLGLKDDVFLSFLPLSHAYEHTAGQFFPISLGAQIYYAEGAEKLLVNMAEARPTLVMAVPRLYEMMHARIMRGVEKEGGKKEALFMKTLALGKKAFTAPDTMTLMEKIQNFVLEKLVRQKIAQRFGGRLKAFVSGGAPLNPDIGLFFTALGVRILQGYGQTESGPVVSVNVPQKIKMHAVGPIFPDTEVKIAEDGEILVRGELVMAGYWGDEQATQNTIKNGWLHTGDIGVIDADGHLQITDRKKDIIVNSGGDNIAPQRIEGMLTLEPEIAQAMVFGDKRPHLTGLLVPDAEWLKTWTIAHGKPSDLGQLVDDADLHKTLMDAVNRVNTHLSNIEKVRKFIIADEPFTIENTQMTPTLKVRRHKLIEHYGERLNALYS